MATVFTVTAPLAIVRPRSKNYILNLNVYQRTHYKSTNNMKKAYKELMAEQILSLPVLSRIHITYTVYPKTKRLTDTSNVCSVHDKFFCDALVELGRLEDDNYTFLPDIDYRFGAVDKDNPRVEITIKELPNGT